MKARRLYTSTTIFADKFRQEFSIAAHTEQRKKTLDSKPHSSRLTIFHQAGHCLHSHTQHPHHAA